MGDVMDIGLSSWSYSMWFNTNDGIANQILFSKALAASSNGRIWSGFINNRVVFGFQAEVTNVIVTEMNTSTLGTNTWYHLVVVLDRSDKLKIYLNGTLQGLTVTSGTNDLTPHTTNYNNTHPFRIGAYTASDNTTPIAFFNGKIDEFNIWNRVLTPTEVTELYKCSFGSFYPFPITQSVDSDVCAFITNASITDITQQSAINTLVTDLKGYGLWTKMKAVYPFVGGTANSHKYNLIDARDDNSAYRLSFNGDVTHSSNGMILGGTNGYANTYLNDNVFTVKDLHISMYSKTNQAAEKWDFGARNTADNTGTFFGLKGANTEFIACLQGITASGNINNTNTTGFYIANRKTNDDIVLNKNGSEIFRTPKATVGTSNYPYFIGTFNEGGTPLNQYSAKTLAGITIGSGLTVTESSNLYTAFQTFNTALSRPY
jgi:hypothetical protein